MRKEFDRIQKDFASLYLEEVEERKIEEDFSYLEKEIKVMNETWWINFLIIMYLKEYKK